MRNNLFIFIIISFIAFDGYCAIRVNNYDKLKKSGFLDAQKTTSVSDLPVEIDAKIAKRIENGEKNIIDIHRLKACSEIYPEGKFAWSVPDAGTNKKSEHTCVSVIEMRAIKGTEDIVVAKAYVAAGDSIECNIDKFPESGYTQEAGNIDFPADNPPTIEEVEKVMDEEQKQNAVFKIVAGALVGGVTGNMAGKSNNNSMFGTNKEKMKTSAIGALSGAAVMAGNAYTGKVTGDIIMSTGINAAAGGVVGNMLASGESVLKVEDCTFEGRQTKCLWGVIQNIEPSNCDDVYYELDTGRTVEFKEEKITDKIMFISKLDGSDKKLDELRMQQFKEIRDNKDKLYHKDEEGKMKDGAGGTGNTWAKALECGTIESQTPAMIPDFKEKTFGTKLSDWYTYDKSNLKVLGRNTNGTPYELKDQNNTEFSYIDRFYPVTVNASDGNVIDINNKARIKETLIGSGVGAGLGALSGYQGAKNAIEERWFTEVQQYKDSLQKIYCGTGKRFLSHYNDTVIIPNIRN